ncbi:MAG: hypothetical protein QM783_07340 [Phycisphaerales bacterium]
MHQSDSDIEWAVSSIRAGIRSEQVAARLNGIVENGEEEVIVQKLVEDEASSGKSASDSLRRVMEKLEQLTEAAPLSALVLMTRLALAADAAGLLDIRDAVGFWVIQLGDGELLRRLGNLKQNAKERFEREMYELWMEQLQSK